MFSSTSSSIKPLLNKAKTYPFNLSPSIIFKTATMANRNTKIMEIQFVLIAIFSSACTFSSL